jgi:hypothetical protein
MIKRNGRTKQQRRSSGRWLSEHAEGQHQQSVDHSCSLIEGAAEKLTKPWQCWSYLPRLRGKDPSNLSMGLAASSRRSMMLSTAFSMALYTRSRSTGVRKSSAWRWKRIGGVEGGGEMRVRRDWDGGLRESYVGGQGWKKTGNAYLDGQRGEIDLGIVKFEVLVAEVIDGGGHPELWARAEGWMEEGQKHHMS